MKGYVVTVEFDIDPARFAVFMTLMTENAAASLRDEKGCRHFDVCRPRDVASRVFLYEIYDDEAAFQAHLQTTHFKTFAAATKDMITGRRIVACDLVG
ncbi:MAG TPA: putative quinol monooxygenase [Stellaceae bacterium]|jgi:quinol monooxygenase YgiN|nr:putative quinol monooxygenase [Stellaceae bacterium]